MQLNNKLRIFGGIAIGVSMVIWLTCSYNEPVAGGSTETTNSKICGVVYNSDGSAAKGITVSLRPKNTLADTFSLREYMSFADDTATVATDDNGRFVFDTIDTGVYVIEGDDGNNNRVLIDSVMITSFDSVISLSGTLQPAGAIAGTIYLSEGGDFQKVFVLAFGINRFAVVDGNGKFTFTGLAEAIYNIRIISSMQDYGVLDTFGIQVLSNEITSLDSLELPFIGIPKPKNLTVAYDTLRQIVILQWAPSNSNLVKGFNIYRCHSDSSFTNVPINPILVVDTMYHDSTASQDQQYEYKVSSVDTNDEEGKKSEGQNVVIVPAFTLVDSLGSEGTGIGQFTFIRDMCFDKDGNLYVVSYENNTGDNPRIQKFDSSHTCVLSFGTKGSGASQFMQPSGVAVDESLNVYIADKGNGRVQKFRPDGSFISSFSGNSNDSSKLESPEQVCVYNNEIFIADYSNSQYYSSIKKFDSEGNFLLKWGSKGDGDGEFYQIYSIKSSINGNIITLDDNGVQFFNNNGVFIKRIKLPLFNEVFKDLSISKSAIYLTMSNGVIIIIDYFGMLEGLFSTNNPNVDQITVLNKEIYISYSNECLIRILK